MTTSAVPLKNIQELHALQEEIVKHISSNRSFYLKIDDSGPEKSIKIVTGWRAGIYNFFGSEKFDLEKVLSVFETKIKKAKEELDTFSQETQPTGIYKELVDYQYALLMVVDLIAFKYGEWNLKNYRPQGEVSLEKRALDLRNTFFVHVKPEITEIPVTMPAKEISVSKEETLTVSFATKQLSSAAVPAPEKPLVQSIKTIQTETVAPQTFPTIVKEPELHEEAPPSLLENSDLKVLHKMEGDLFIPLWAHKKTKEKSVVGWEFHDDAFILREELIGGQIKEERFTSPVAVFKKMNASLQIATIEFQEHVLRSLDLMELDPLSAILRQDLKSEFERLRSEANGIQNKDDLLKHASNLTKFLKSAKVLLDMNGIAINGKIPRPNRDSALLHKKERNAEILFLILELKTLAKISFVHLSRVGPLEKKEQVKEITKKIVLLFNETPSGFHKEGYLKCLSLIQELQQLNVSWEEMSLKVEGQNVQLPPSAEFFNDFLAELHRTGLKLLLHEDKAARERSHFLDSDRGMPGKRIFERLQESFDLRVFTILINAHLVKPVEAESWKAFVQLEFDEFRAAIQEFSKKHLDRKEQQELLKKVSKIPKAPTAENLAQLYDALRSHQTLWDKHHETLGIASLNKLKTGLERDLTIP